MAALRGTLDEWVRGESGTWSRIGHPEDGEVNVSDFVAYYAKRVKDELPLTPAELAVEDAAEIEKTFTVPGVLRAIVKDRFDLENRIRVLEGKPAITLAQFKTALANRIRGA